MLAIMTTLAYMPRMFDEITTIVKDAKHGTTTFWQNCHYCQKRQTTIVMFGKIAITGKSTKPYIAMFGKIAIIGKYAKQNETMFGQNDHSW